MPRPPLRECCLCTDSLSFVSVLEDNGLGLISRHLMEINPTLFDSLGELGLRCFIHFVTSACKHASFWFWIFAVWLFWAWLLTCEILVYTGTHVHVFKTFFVKSTSFCASIATGIRNAGQDFNCAIMYDAFFLLWNNMLCILRSYSTNATFQDPYVHRLPLLNLCASLVS